MDDQQFWDGFCARRERLRLPLRPDGQVAARLAKVVSDRDARVLMLGLTPEIAGIGRDLTIAEWNREMLRRAWPADRPDARPALVDWREMRFAGAAFTAAIGDGSLSTVRWPEDYRLVFARVAQCLAPGARLAVRCFVAPDRAETLDAIHDEVMAGAETSFHAVKWRVSMAVAARMGGNVPVEDILAGFEQCFPDRDALVARTGWTPETIAEIDGFRTPGIVLSFVTREQLVGTLSPGFTDVRFVSSGDYPLAGRCPFLVAEYAGRG